MWRILVPLDGTKKAEAALASLQRFSSNGDEIVLLFVHKPERGEQEGYTPGAVVAGGMTGPGGSIAGVALPDSPHYVETTDQVIQREVDESKDYLERLAASLREHGHKVDTEVLVNAKPDEAIIEYARRTQPTFIVMLRRTHPSLGERLFGGVAQSVVKADVAPVLFVPETEAKS